MSILNHLHIPAGAAPLRARTTLTADANPSSPSPILSNRIGATTATSSSHVLPPKHDPSPLHAAHRETIPLPNPSPPLTPTATSSSLAGDRLNSNPLSPTFSLLPQMLISSALPGGVGLSAIPGMASAAAGAGGGAAKTVGGGGGGESGSGGGGGGGGGTKTKLAQQQQPTLLMSTKDPLSIPIMTNNFKRFVARVGPVFWVQDRIEEIMFWRRGWKVTGMWMAVYVFLCECFVFIFLFGSSHHIVFDEFRRRGADTVGDANECYAFFHRLLS